EPAPAPAVELPDDPIAILTPEQIAALAAAAAGDAPAEEPAPAPAVELPDDPNAILTPEQIAALAAAAAGDAPAEEPAPEPAPAEEAPAAEEPAMSPEEIAAIAAHATGADDPNANLTAEQIEAMFDAAGVRDPVPEEAPAEEPAAAEEAPAAEEPAMSPEEIAAIAAHATGADDPNANMTAEEIEAMFDAAGVRDPVPEEAPASEDGAEAVASAEEAPATLDATADLDELDALMSSLASDEIEDLGTAAAEEAPATDAAEEAAVYLAGLGENDEDKLPDVKEKRKLFGRKKKEKAAPAEGEEKEKVGFFKRLIGFLTEDTDEDEEGAEGAKAEGAEGEIATLTEENQQVLNELAEQDGGKKKGKKEKPVPEGPPQKRIPPKRVAIAFLFAATLGALFIVPALLLPPRIAVRDAVNAFYDGDYARTYKELYGKENLDEEADLVFRKSRTILRMRRFYDSYDSYQQSGLPVEALNALIKGVYNYEGVLAEASAYADPAVDLEIRQTYDAVCNALSYEYQMTPEEALRLYALEDRLLYTMRLQEIAGIR
ncbi:MAG: hypothetical protein IJQ21_07340, partial [Lachnospiraceae bacterium]|nr:hypothetical protein [Lachnospiraceae bacterium]